MKDPAFSIITPTFNRPELLLRNINSVACQTFNDYEHIIIDDSGTRKTERIIAENNDKRIVYYAHETSKGAAAAYNTGLRYSRGRYILFLDDDDEYLPDFLEKMHERFRITAPEIGFILSGFTRIIEKESGEFFSYSHVWPSEFTSKEEGLIAATSIGNGCGVCIRRECISEVGLYDEAIKYGHDTEYLFRLARKYDFVTIPECLVKLHSHESGRLNDDKNNLERLSFREEFLLKNSDLLDTYPKLYAIHHKVVVELSYNLGLRKNARKNLYKIILKNPLDFRLYVDIIFYEVCGKNLLYFRKNNFLKRLFLKAGNNKCAC